MIFRNATQPEDAEDSLLNLVHRPPCLPNFKVPASDPQCPKDLIDGFYAGKPPGAQRRMGQGKEWV